MKVNKTVIAASKVIFYVNYFKIVEHHIQKRKKRSKDCTVLLSMIHLYFTKNDVYKQTRKKGRI